jgi:CBS domain containing-hemolysin-like protein
LIEKKVRNNEYVFSGRLEIEYLNSKYTLNIPESEEYDTLAGYILFHFHNLPKNKQVIETENFIFTILKGTNTRIELVLLKVKI